ncbi:energy transducer TonB [Ferrovibrio sp. MS7]|uniref:energy transducer TonB n=1 Tax=Ferrovibrio plantarum TaxID=3119164 RepID=UPI003136C3B5
MSWRSWGISVVLHGAALGGLLVVLDGPRPLDARGEELPSIAIQLASLPPPPPAPAPPPPPPPVVEQPMPVIESKAPEPLPEPEPPPPPPKPKLRPPPPQKVETLPPPKPVEAPPQPVQQAMVAPAPVPASPSTQTAAVAAPPAAVATGNPNAEQDYLARLSIALEKYKDYPRRAVLRNLEGVPQLRFTLDREGRVIAFALHRSSGSEILDEAALDMIKRAKTLPAFPEEITRDRWEIVVPVRFSLKR